MNCSNLPDEFELCIPNLHNTCRSIIVYWIEDFESFMTDPDGHPWTPRVQIQQHLERVWTLSFSPTGKWLVSGAWDSMVYVYATDSLETASTETVCQEPVRCALYCFANVWAAEFQPSFRESEVGVLATGAADHKVIILCLPLMSVSIFLSII